MFSLILNYTNIQQLLLVVAGWLAGWFWLAGWLVLAGFGWLAGWFWLAGWLVLAGFGWFWLVLAGWLAAGWLAAGWLAGWLAGFCWLAGRLASGVYNQLDQLTHYLMTELKCDICGAEFSTRDNLTRHKRRTHAIRRNRRGSDQDEDDNELDDNRSKLDDHREDDRLILPSGSSTSISRSDSRFGPSRSDDDDIARRVEVQVRLALAQEKANQLSQEMLQRDRKQREEQIKVKELTPGGREPLRGRWDKYSKCIAFRILLRKPIPSPLRLSVGADADIKPQQGRFERRRSSSL